MTYIDYYLKFATESDATSALFNIDGSQTYDAAYDIIGEFSLVDNSDPDNLVITKQDGYFVNIRSSKEIEFPESAIVETPATPWRVFA